MATETKLARWKVILGYSAFALFSFLLCLFLTFPYDTLRARVATEAAQAGLAVRIGSLRPGFFGLTARDVQVSKPPEPLGADAYAALTSGNDDALAMMGPAVLGEPLILSAVSMRPSLFPLGVKVDAEALGGEVRGSFGGSKELNVRLELKELKPSEGNLPAFLGVDMEGALSGVLTLVLPRAGGKEPDLAQANGQLTLDTAGLAIKGGKVSIPMGGGPPVPMDLPQVALGAITGRIQFEKGLGTVQELRIKSDDLEALATGTLKLGKKLAYSELGMDVKLKAAPEFVKRLGLLGAGLSILPPDKQDPSFRSGRLTGFLQRPNFLPRR